MSLRVSGKNLDIGAALRTHVQARIAASTAKYLNGDVTGHVTIGPEGSGYKTECFLRLPSGIMVTAEGEAHEPYASFDKTADRIDKRLRRYKQRVKDHHGAGISAAPPPDTEMASYVIEALDADIQENEVFSPAVVLFRHATQQRLNLVYRRQDGAIGWIDPEGRVSRN